MLRVTDTAPAPTLLIGDQRASWRWRTALFALWAAAAGWLTWMHVVWRDEVRAWSLALSGDSVAAMLRAIHGEGHPALWYLLLRGGYALTGTSAVLPATALLIAAAAAALVAWRAPFRSGVIALILFSGYALWEYAAVARNYGIAMLLIVALAATYERAKTHGWLFGVLLFLLCNTNVVAVLAAGGFVLCRGLELWVEEGGRWTTAARQFAIAAGLALAGTLACAATVYPPYNDAAMVATSHATMLPLATLSGGLAETVFGSVLFMLIVAGSVIGLARSPAAMVAALAVALGATLFFALIYPGFYRHQAIVLVFLIAMYWLAATGRGGRWPASVAARHAVTLRAAERYGAAAFVALLALQSVTAVGLIAMTLEGRPLSRSRDLASLLHRPELARAIVIANPDIELEALSFYAPNPTYLVREHRFGRVVAFTRAALREVSLGELLRTARRLQATSGRPIVIVMRHPLDPSAPAQRWNEGMLGTFTTTPREVRGFVAATQPLARFGPAMTDESYAVYRLR